MSTILTPKVTPSAREDANQLYRAFKGMGCDTSLVVSILAHRDAAQRESIQMEYETMFSEDLNKRISSELHGHVKKAILLWMPDPSTREAIIVRQALIGTLVDFKAITEVICSRTSSQIRQLKQVYTTMFKSDLERDVGVLAFGDLKKLLLAYITTPRYEGPEIDNLKVERDVKAVRKADYETLINIFTDRSRAHMTAVSVLYQTMFDKPIEKVIKSKTSGNFEYGLLTILWCAESPVKYYAKVLRKAMKGIGTADTTLIRVVVSRAEIDMQYIKTQYQKKYRKSLIDAVSSDTSGHYRDFLVSLLGYSH